MEKIARLKVSTYEVNTDSRILSKIDELVQRFNQLIDLQEEKKGKWKPKDGEGYYFFDTNGTTANTTFRENFDWDLIHVEFGNCFQTRGEAQAAADKIKELLQSI